MFEKYLVNPEGFRNVRENNQITGYEVQLRVPYYRGIPMSCVEVLDLTVDDEKVANEDMLITVKGGRAQGTCLCKFEDFLLTI